MTGSLKPVNLRIPTLKFGPLRIISAKTLILGISLSLATVSSTPAVADDNVSPTSYQVVVNKLNPLSLISYEPTDLVKPGKYNPLKLKVRAEVATKLIAMGNAMKKKTKSYLSIRSAYRSYATQVQTHSRAVASKGVVVGEQLAARPGYSEHQTGLAVDLNWVSTKFANTKEGKWLANNAYRFGFILRYPKDQTAITGYQFEPWHFRYVGVNVATDMHTRGILTLEEYYGYPNAPDYGN